MGVHYCVLFLVVVHYFVCGVYIIHNRHDTVLILCSASRPLQALMFFVHTCMCQIIVELTGFNNYVHDVARVRSVTP